VGWCPEGLAAPPTIPRSGFWELDPDHWRSAQIQSLWAHGTSTRHFRVPVPLEDAEVKFVIELQVGCAADSSCHDPYRWVVTPPADRATNISPAKLKAIPINGAMKRMQLSLRIRPSRTRISV
jgi:hypothetical protein